ncbi:MAG: DMT family transporter [Azoarcus sp.]|nr:DMT family transporter [Azoarcus sp.]
MKSLGLPLLFITLYGSGFVGAKVGLIYAEPFMFLGLRFGAAAMILAAIALTLRSPWPKTLGETAHLAGAGLLTIGVFSAGVFYSIALGVPPAMSALIIALHPIIVALAAGRLLGERVSLRQWGGLLLGLVGVYFVLSERLLVDPAFFGAALLSVIGLLGLSSGNLYQKAKAANMNVFSGGAIQCAVCAKAMFTGAWLFEAGEINWTHDFLFALIWMTVPVSVGAVSLLYVMIRRGEISRVASIFYLIPVSAAVTAFVLFGQTIETSALGGIALTALGVLLVSKPAGVRQGTATKPQDA